MRLIRFWKPYNVLTGFTDRDGRATLADYISVPGVYPAGRLDYDSEGLLLLTDSGWLNARLTQPRFGHPRTYWAQVERIPNDAALERLRAGVMLSDGPTLPAQVSRLDGEPVVNGLPLGERSTPIRFRKQVPTAWIALTLTEGRNRQVRRMTAAIGHPTLRLVRAGIGTGGGLITLDGLAEGGWESVSDEAVARLAKSIRRR
jgi:23S rRNA pseudouridine2457 synthase